MDRESEGAWTERWTAGTGFRVTCYVRTENVEGRGSCVAVRWGVYNNPERFPYVCSEKLTGSTDWTKLTVEIQGPPPDIGAIYIILRQDGSGTTWFDDMEVTVL